MPIPLIAAGVKFGISLLGSFLGGGHARAVQKENQAIGSGSNQVDQQLTRLFQDAQEGRLTAAGIDSRLKAILEGYYSAVGGVIKGRISSFSEFNPSTKKTISGQSCNAACVIGGQVQDAIMDARPKLLALLKAANKGGTIQSTGGLDSGSRAVPSSGTSEASVLSALPFSLPFDWRWLLLLLPGGIVLYFIFRKRSSR